MGNKRIIINEAFLIEGLRHFFHYRKKKKEEFYGNSFERDLPYFRKLLKRFEYEYILASSVNRKQLNKKFLLFAVRYLHIIDDDSDNFINYAQNCATYCIEKIGNFSNSVFRSWFDKEVNSSRFIIPSNLTLRKKIKNLLKLHVSGTDEFFLLSPLQFAEIESNLRLGDDCVILSPHVNHLTSIKDYFKYRDFSEQCKFISEYFPQVKPSAIKELIDTLEHYKTCYGDKSNYHPLLLIHQNDIRDNVCDWAIFSTKYTRFCILLSLLCTEYKLESGAIKNELIRTVSRVYIFDRNSFVDCSPFRYPQANFCYDLSPLKEVKCQKIFQEIYNLIWERGELLNLYRRTLRFFFWDADDGAKTFEHRNIKFIMQIIAMEMFLLGGRKDSAKKIPMSYVLSRLYEGRKYNKKQIRYAVRAVYDSRSDFVHDGLSITEDYFEVLDKSFIYRCNDESLNIVVSTFANVLAKGFPNWYLKHKSSDNLLNEWQKYTRKLSVPKIEAPKT